MRISAKFGSLVLLALLLSSCAKNPFVVVTSNCPAVAVAANTGTLTRFRGDGRNVSDIELEAVISGITIDCDEDDNRGVRQEVRFAITARRPAGSNLNSVTLPYFVVLVRDNNLITAKRVYEATLNFAPGADRTGVQETIVQTLDDLDTARRYDYELLIGFQLSPDEASYNILR